MDHPRLYTIDPGVPFLETLASAILGGQIFPQLSRANGALALAATTIYVPTQRAAQALKYQLALAHGSALLLPRIVPLGLEEDSATRALFDPPEFTQGDADIPPAIGELERRMQLMRLVLAWGASVRHAIISVDADGVRSHDDEILLVATTPADAWKLAEALASLIDEMIVEDIAWDRLLPLAERQFDRYWRITLDFLSIAVQNWPKHLAESGRVDPATRRALLLDRDIARLRGGAMPGPVIIAGSTGVHKATARLMQAVAQSPQGAIILPGLDKRLDSQAYGMISGGEDGGASGGHPQAALSRLLGLLQQPREEFQSLGQPDRARAWRTQFLSEAMRPAGSTHVWSDADTRMTPAQIDAALAGVTLVEAAHEGEEALALAVALREALETPGRTAALITPDRGLALRVSAELRRWGIRIADSGGEPLPMTRAGTLALLVLDCAGPELEAAALLALLRHPVTRLGGRRDALEALLAPLEIGVLRGPLPPGALRDPAGLVAQAQTAAKDKHAHPARARITPQEWSGGLDLLQRAQAALAGLASLPRSAPLSALVSAHQQAVLALAAGEQDSGAPGGRDGVALLDLFEAASSAAGSVGTFSLPDYRAFFQRLAAERVVPLETGTHDRIAILGLLEARLLPFDLVLLGGLDEGVWPPVADSGPFLNRPMRAALGLTPPERRIGQTAHDFVMAMGTREVILSRARKRGGTPTVASRFLQRMAALAGVPSWQACKTRGARYVAWARGLDHGPAAEPAKRPEPRPPVHLRPQRLSVTQIETLRRDPYGIYAAHVLKLQALEGIGLDYSARDFGSWTHEALRQFGERFASGPLPPIAQAELVVMTRAAFGAMAQRPEFQTFHWPQIERALVRFVDWENQRRGGIARLLTEIKGGLEIDLPDGSRFYLNARADRIEVHADGSIGIVDYKTGAVPGTTDVRAGWSPQLPLEAAIAVLGGFAAVPKNTRVTELLHFKLGADDKPPQKNALGRNQDIAAAATQQHDELVKLLDDFRNPLRSYPSRPFPGHTPAFSDFLHLARVKEWSGSGGDDEAGDESGGEEGE